MGDTQRGECSVKGCDRVTEARGMCQAHYLRWRAHGDPRADVPIKVHTARDGICVVEGCERDRAASGYCGPHYNRLRRYGDPLAGGTYREYKRNEPCRADGCERMSQCQGYCIMHYARLQRHGDVTRERPAERGSVHRSGYRYLHRPRHPNASKHGWIAEHRLVMSERLGRALVPGENVHHLNGDKLDNRDENLELWTTSQPKGQRAIDKLSWAREILALYEPVETLLAARS